MDEIGSKIDGLEFLDDVKSGCFINYDGYIGYVLINNDKNTKYNLNYVYYNQSEWIKLCKNNSVIVNWINR